MQFLLCVCVYLFSGKYISFCGNLTCHPNAICTPAQECICVDEFVGNGTSCQPKIESPKKKSYQSDNYSSALDVKSGKHFIDPGDSIYTLYLVSNPNSVIILVFIISQFFFVLIFSF